MRGLGAQGAVVLAAVAVVAAGLLPLSIGEVEPGGDAGWVGEADGRGETGDGSDDRSREEDREDGSGTETGTGPGTGSGSGPGDGPEGDRPNFKISPPTFSPSTLLVLAGLVLAGAVVSRWVAKRRRGEPSPSDQPRSMTGDVPVVQPGGSWFPQGPAKHIALAYRQACQAVSHVISAPTVSETPTAFADRAPEACRQTFSQLTLLYLAARYEGRSPTAVEVQRARALGDEIVGRLTWLHAEPAGDQAPTSPTDGGLGA